MLKKELVLFTFFTYLLSVITATIIPLNATERVKFASGNINLVPVYRTVYKFVKYQGPRYPMELHMLYLNFFGNILLFVPLGFMLPLLNKHIDLKRVLLISTSASVFIELSQYIGYLMKIYRYVDIDDVILNVLGAVIGFWMYKLFIRWKAM